MNRLLCRLLLLVATIFIYLAGTIITFLYGSSWLANSAFTLAICPALFASGVVAVYLIITKMKTGTIRLTDALLATVLLLFFSSVSLGLLGFFSAIPDADNVQQTAGSGFIKSGDAWLYYHQSNSAVENAPVLLVLHGGPGSGAYTLRAEIGDSLEQDFTMIYLDQRGTGRSTWAKTFTLEDYLNDIENVRKALRIDAFYLLSVSWGAVLANEYTLRYPDHVKGIINWGGLVSAQDETKTMIRHLVFYYETQKDDEAITYWASLLKQDNAYSRLQTYRTVNKINQLGLKSVFDKTRTGKEILAYRKRAIGEWGYKKNEASTNLWATAITIMQLNLEDYNASHKLASIRQPYLFLAGRYDPQMDFEKLNLYKNSMPDASLEIIENSGHVIDNPAEFIRCIKTFVISRNQESLLKL